MAKNKKPLIILGIIIVIAIAFFVIAKNPTIIYTIFNIEQKNNTILKDGITLKDPYFLDKVIVIHKTGCPSCAIALPILEQIEKDNNMTFYYYNVFIQAQLTEVTSLNIIPEYVPTVIIYGKVYVGAKTKEQYEAAILKK